MSNYTPSGAPTPQTRGVSSSIHNEFAAIGIAVNSKADLAGQVYSGTHDYTAGTVKVPTLSYGSSGNNAASVDYVNTATFAAVLPAQPGNAGKFISTNGSTASWTFPPMANYLYVREEQSFGTQGGSNISGEQTRTLNTAVKNAITGASLASNVITLPAGTYQVKARAPANQVGLHKAYLYNVSDSTYVLTGANANAVSTSDSTISGQFTIAATKTFVVKHFTNSVVATTGLGQSAASTGRAEVYTEVEIWKVA